MQHSAKVTSEGKKNPLIFPKGVKKAALKVKALKYIQHVKKTAMKGKEKDAGSGSKALVV